MRLWNDLTSSSSCSLLPSTFLVNVHVVAWFETDLAGSSQLRLVVGEIASLGMEMVAEEVHSEEQSLSVREQSPSIVVPLSVILASQEGLAQCIRPALLHSKWLLPLSSIVNVLLHTLQSVKQRTGASFYRSFAFFFCKKELHTSCVQISLCLPLNANVLSWDTVNFLQITAQLSEKPLDPASSP